MCRNRGGTSSAHTRVHTHLLLTGSGVHSWMRDAGMCLGLPSLPSWHRAGHCQRVLGCATSHSLSLFLHLGRRTGAHEATAGLTQGGLGPQPCGSALSSGAAQSGHGEVCPGSVPGVDVVMAVGISGGGPQHVLGGLLGVGHVS